jgi:hypothetical protein
VEPVQLCKQSPLSMELDTGGAAGKRALRF